MTQSDVKKPVFEHTVPWFWPFAAAIEMEEEGLELFRKNLTYLSEAEKLVAPRPPKWATGNRVRLDLDTMRLRDFSSSRRTGNIAPVVVDAPYAGHSAMIADYAPGQSLIETLLASGLKHVFLTDWKSATPEMRDFDIDKYLAEINVVVDDLGGSVNLVGLCQGGWMSAMYAARYPDKVQSLVLAGSPIDANAGKGPIRKIAHSLPASFYEEMVEAGGGRMLGQYMLAGWKNMHPEKQYLGKFIDLYEHIQDKCYIHCTERFERWYENPIDLPGRYYLQAVEQIFKKNLFAKGKFTGLGRKLSLKDIVMPVYLLAGKDDDITTKEQVFGAETLVGTPSGDITKSLVPGGHIGLFMGTKALGEAWPEIGRWIGQNGKLS